VVTAASATAPAAERVGGNRASHGVRSGVGRPLPVLPRGAASPRPPSDRLVLTCPRISPEWQLAATLALVKPKPYTKRMIQHRDAKQPWPRNARRIICDFVGTLDSSLAGVMTVDFPTRGEHRLTVEFTGEYVAQAKRIARRLSKLLPELWFVLGETEYARGGVVYHRVGKYKLELVRARRVRLRRAVRFGFYSEVDDAVAPAGERAGQDPAA
jgi:hypothetical protein